MVVNAIAENKGLCKRCKDIEEHNKILRQQMGDIQNTLEKHTGHLEKILIKVYPPSAKLNVFPITSRQDLEKIDKKLAKIPVEQVIESIKELIGKAPIHKCLDLFFSHEVLLQSNWDGVKNKIAIKNLKTFNAYVYGAVKSETLSYTQFEDKMRKGFRLAKGRIYKQTYKNKK